MSDKEKLISEVLILAEKAGLYQITPIELSNGGNLIIHLDPHPIVARIATVLSKEDADYAYKTLDRELRVAHHLQSKGIPALLPSDHLDAGPHDIGGTWMTFWKYVPHTPLKPPSPSEAVELVNALSLGMKYFSGEIPLLGVWERTCHSAKRLMNHPDPRIQALLKVFVKVDRQMRLETSLLIPCHGDAHTRNLLPSPEGWIWSDFEDLSRMPAYWDLASYVGNLALFNGVQEPTFMYILSQLNNGSDLEAFGFAITARTLMSTLGNLDFALAGNGDLEFASKQLELAEDFIRQIDLIIQKNGEAP
ncbi:aminoglycoside phosphotransferase family protein [Gorillibacterium timonense]|uniref:aminoglycoside phosphotransferase family protein n=1 Tax=Gorillibacterium timonense TaxID=1689269 RepID=UPI00071D9B47|nr:aminoglycoside phosphotransferase family protein [Gorillibacterium timonense]